MTDDRPPKRLVDDPETPEDMKEDLRRSSEIPLPSELSEKQHWNALLANLPQR